MVVQRKWWTVKQLAEHYGLAPRTIYDAIASGHLVAHRFGKGRGGMRVLEDERLSWEQKCRGSASAPLPEKLQNRLVTADLVRKHFGQ